MLVKMSRKAGWTAALFGVGFATLALAQAPNPNDAASVKAWQAKNNIIDRTSNPETGWQPLTAIDGALLMRGVLVPRNAGGQSMIGLRMEFFAPTEGSLSELDSFMVDCLGNRMRQIEQATFPQHNLSGAKKGATLPETSPDGAWGPMNALNGLLEGTARASCAPAAGGSAPVVAAAAAPARQAGPPFNLADQNAGNRWLTDNRIDRTLEANTLIGFGPTGAMFRTARTDTAHQMSASTPRFLFRQEYYGAKTLSNGKTSLSWAGDYDINCRQRSFRIVNQREYVSHNLSGEAALVTDTKDAPFTPVANDPVLKDVFEDICRS